MDTRTGTLTVAGWWHFGFSVIQTWALLCFLVAWICAGRVRMWSAVRLGVRAWSIYALFTALALADIAMRRLWVLRTRPQAGAADAMAVLPCAAALAILAAMSAVGRRGALEAAKH